MLDMCNILTTLLVDYDFGECLFFHRLGSSSVQLFCHYLSLPIDVCELMSPDEFAVGYNQLKEAGFALQDQETALEDIRRQNDANMHPMSRLYANITMPKSRALDLKPTKLIS